MDSNRRNYSSNVYTFNNFLDSLRMLSDTNTESTSQCEKKEQNGKEYQRNELSELKKENFELRAMVEQLKGDLQKESAFNNEFNINFDLMQNKYQNDIKAIEIMNEEKDKKITELSTTVAKQSELTDSLQSTIANYEKLIDKMKEALEKQQVQIDQLANNQPQQPQNENQSDFAALQEENRLKDELISKMKQKIEASNQMIEDINKMKEDINVYADKIKELYSEIQNRDKVIAELKQKIDSNSSESNVDYKERYEVEKQKNEKTKEDIGKIDDMIKKLIQSKEEMRKSYEDKIKELISKLEIVSKEKGVANSSNSKYSEEEVMKIVEENKELEKFNKYLIQQMDKLPELEQHFKKLFDEMMLLKKENEELKKQVNPNEVQSNENNEEEEEENEQKEEEQKEENEPEEENINDQPAKETNTSIPQDLSLFSITRNYLLCFNLKQKKFISVDPKGYDVFYQSYTSNGSISYNTLSGLFILSGPNFDTLYYYSSKNNSIVKFFTFKFNHQNGIIFLDTSSKYLLAVSGTNTNKVERLCFETQVIDELPSLNATRGEASCCLVNDVVYVFFGYSPEKKKCLDSVEYLDMKNVEEGWKVIELNEKQFELKGVSVARLGAREMIIVGGENGKGEANKNMIYFNADEKKMTKLEKTLPEGDKKKEYLFKKNSMFNFFAEGDTICYANIDDDNCVHVIDNNLKYELFML